jgi:hypothetical protein
LSETHRPDVAADWLAAMRRGDWEQAWQATDRLEIPRRARQCQPGFARAPEHLRWDGTPPAGRVVLVRCEHGLGDTLQFMRFLPRLRARRLHFLVQPPLVELLRDAPGLGEVRNYWTDDPLPDHEVDMEVMELAYALRVRMEEVPAPYPHLHGRLADASALLGGDDGRLRVGLLWSVSDWAQDRSVPLHALAPLFDVPGVRYFSLQQGEAALDPQLQRLDIEVLSPCTAAIPMAAASLCRMDLVICPDSMPAHLAGTLGVPTWVMLKRDADWRWMTGREDSPWYPGVRLFRQQPDGDWLGVVRRIAAALEQAAQAHAIRTSSPADRSRSAA